MAQTRKPRRYQFLGWIIEKAPQGWYVLDWDYESENVAHYATTEQRALDWAEMNS